MAKEKTETVEKPKPVSMPDHIKVDSAEQEMREYAYKMLWIMYRMPKCGSTKDIGKALPKFKKWVGEKRADELEEQWRKGSA